MGTVIPFPQKPALRLVCSETSEQVHADVAFLNSLLQHKANIVCPTCIGRGLFIFKDAETGLLDSAPCPCGGTDEDRISPDFGGAA
ncbi:hypothetical protein [Microvirga mediterraneensis]|uniref:Uncharacterized protein n=1 Tax=Microvirga mediterraneensis TaxID=2754695 RepID=A0A838BNC2_9HYPH|nr:hypothetical protein [Microvirga mediterraneensis]MBA1156900.1 hypothetical protein [Microvirga mediterraneensis]